MWGACRYGQLHRHSRRYGCVSCGSDRASTLRLPGSESSETKLPSPPPLFLSQKTGKTRMRHTLVVRCHPALTFSSAFASRLEAWRG